MSATQIRLGATAKVYYNTGTYGTPVWTEIDIVRDVTLNVENGEWDASYRGSGGWSIFVATLKKAEVDIDALHQPLDTGYIALRGAVMAYPPGTLDMAIFNGPIATGSVGNQGLRSLMAIMSKEATQPLEEGQMDKWKVKPGIDTAGNTPTWMITA